MTMNEYLTISGKKVSFDSKHGSEIYRRSLVVLLQTAVNELYRDIKLRIGQTLMNGYYFERACGSHFPPDFIERVTDKMKEIVKRDEKFEKRRVPKERAAELFREAGRDDKLRAVSFLSGETVELVWLRGYFDLVVAECIASAGFLGVFRLLPYNSGIIMQLPRRNPVMTLPGTENRQEKLYEVYLEARRWGEILGVTCAPDLNRAVSDGAISTLIKVQEAMHEKKIAAIADRIKGLHPVKRLVFVAGPSASGKTTFIKRLGIQLRVNGLSPVEISLDDYFVPREKTPRKPSGELDFECLEALDTGFFSKQITELLRGREITLPRFDFKSGRRKKSGKKLKLDGGSLVIVEGIHALNPDLCGGIPEEIKFRIFVSALTQLRIDNDTRIFTSDSRLMRRVIRDSLFRGYNAFESIKRFPLVREGEDSYVFPFQDRADVFFNSSLIYEQAVLKPFLAERLRGMESGGLEDLEARRLLNYLDFFLAIPPTDVPQTSILREFIGESGFNY